MSKISRITTTQSPSEYIVSVNSSDSNPSFLADKLNQGDNITLTTENVGGQLVVTIEADAPATTLADLTDTDTSGVADGESLIYNSTTLKWEPSTPASTVSVVKLIIDTTISSMSDVFKAVPHDGALVPRAIVVVLPDPADHTGRQVKIILDNPSYTSEISSDETKYVKIGTASGTIQDDFDNAVANVYLGAHKESITLYSSGTNWLFIERHIPTSTRSIVLDDTGTTLYVRNETSLYYENNFATTVARTNMLSLPEDDALDSRVVGSTIDINAYLPVDAVGGTENILEVPYTKTTGAEGLITITVDTTGNYANRFLLSCLRVDSGWDVNVTSIGDPRNSSVVFT